MIRVKTEKHNTQGKLAHFDFPVFEPPFHVSKPSWKHPEAKALITYDLIMWSIDDDVLSVAKQVLGKDTKWYSITPEVFEEHLMGPLEESGWEIEIHQPSEFSTSVYYAFGRKKQHAPILEHESMPDA